MGNKGDDSSIKYGGNFKKESLGCYGVKHEASQRNVGFHIPVETQVSDVQQMGTTEF